MKKRIISIVLAMVLLVGSVPVTAFATNTQDETELDPGDISISGTNGFGTLLSEELMNYQTGSAEEQDSYEDGYSVAGLTMDGKYATVEYHSMETAVLMVALYSEDWMNLLSSAYVTVSPDDDIATVEFEGEIPEYFQASAYLMDTYDLSPLCAAYTTPLYTKEMQELLNSTVEDYDEDLVLNLDENTDTNFAVYQKDTTVIEAQAGVNTIVSADDERATYVIANADESITSLAAGDVFVYPHGESDILIVKVVEISVDGSTVTIIGDQTLEMEEVFQAVKIEGDSDTSDIEVDTSTADEGVTYLGEEPGDNINYSWEGGAGATASKKFQIKKELEDSTEGGGASASVAFSGTLKLQLDVNVKYYLSLKTQYLEFKLTPTVDAAVEIQTKIELSKKLGFFGVSPCPGVYVGFEPKFKAEFTGAVSANLTIFMVAGFKFDSKTGFQNISTAPAIDTNIDVTGTFFLGVDFCPKLKILDDRVASASLNMLVGGEINATATGSAYEEIEDNSPSLHLCRECLDMDITIKANISGTLQFLNLEWLTFKVNIGNWEFPLGKMYYSLDRNEFAFGSCPNLSYRVTVEVLDRDGKPVPACTVTVSTLRTPLTTNQNGVAVFYTQAGNIRVKAEADGSLASAQKEIKSAEKIVLKLTDGKDGNDAGGDTPGGILGIVDPDEILDGGTLTESGTCGTNVRWALYDNGLLKIFGSGKMEDYSNYSDAAPWYGRDVKHIIIGSSITSIGNRAFFGCSSLTSVTIPDGVTSIGSGAFANCSSLTSITISDSVTSIGVSAFYACSNLTSVTIPDSVTSIDFAAFASCSSLTSITIPDSVTSIGGSAFFGCTSLTSVTIPNSITSIDYQTFTDCSSLTSVSIPDSVTSIGQNAFYACFNLTSLTIPDSVTFIGEAAFYYCTSLTSVTIPNSVTSIDVAAFQSCSGLTSVTISGSVTSIGERAFAGCSRLTSVYYDGTEAQWRSISIGSDNECLTNAYYGIATVASNDMMLPPETLTADDLNDTSLFAVYPGDYGEEDTETGILKTASFTGLVPQQQYILLALRSLEAEDPLSADNLLYIKQGEAAADGTLMFRYMQEESVTVSYVMACGASNKNLSDAEITFPEMYSDGSLQAVGPTVVYDGKTLTEGTDYVITGVADFTDAGNYVCYIRGIYQYTGLVACPYTVTRKDYSVEFDEASAVLTWTNLTENAADVRLIAAAYDSSGKMLLSQTIHQALGGSESVTLNLSDYLGSDVYLLKAFVLSADSLLPLCSAKSWCIS